MLTLNNTSIDTLKIQNLFIFLFFTEKNEPSLITQMQGHFSY